MFTNDKSNEIGKLRLFINDYNEDDYIYDDEDLEVFLYMFETESDPKVKLLKTAILIVTNIAQKMAESVGTRVKIHRTEKEVTIDKANAYKSQLSNLKDALELISKNATIPMIFGGGIYITNKPDYDDNNSNLVPPMFEDNQFDFDEDPLSAE